MDGDSGFSGFSLDRFSEVRGRIVKLFFLADQLREDIGVSFVLLSDSVEWRFGFMPVRRQPDTAY